MGRLHLLEIEDQPWCPPVLRDHATDYLQHVIHVGDAYGPITERLQNALQKTGARRVIDLCSGAGGPWLTLRPRLEEAGHPVEVCLTDLYPNEGALGRLEAASEGRVHRFPGPVDARHVPPELDGFRTLFSSFHHFRPEDARAILRDAVRARQGIAVFEAVQRSAPALLATFLSPPFVWLLTPTMRPVRASRLFWTYLLPLIPAIVQFDGVVSCLRTYTPAELREMTAEFEGTGYVWEIGEAKGKGPTLPVTYLIGYPGGG